MQCAGEFLVTKMMAKTQMELKQGNEDISVRSVVKPKEPMGQDAEQWYQEHCSASIVRRNAMRKYGIGGMLNAAYGTIYIEPGLRKEIGKLLTVDSSGSVSGQFVGGSLKKNNFGN